jgi:hypothetical protein
MADPQILTTLRRKREEIASTIAAYEAKIEDAKRDLSAVNVTLRMFELDGEPSQFPVYIDTKHLWKRGEISKACQEALAAEGPLDTRELALRVIRSKGLDEGDRVLRQSVALRIVHILRMALSRGSIQDGGKRKGVRVWVIRPPR